MVQVYNFVQWTEKYFINCEFENGVMVDWGARGLWDGADKRLLKLYGL